MKIVEAIMNRVKAAVIVRGDLGGRAIYRISPSSSIASSSTDETKSQMSIKFTRILMQLSPPVERPH
jgi:hypothetical protein